MEQLMNVLIVALLSMSSPPPPSNATVQIENWPTLKVTEHLVDAMPPGCSAERTGCAVINFTERTCDIYVAAKEPQRASVRERELRRCRGRDAPPFRLKAAYTQWLANVPCRKGADDGAIITLAAVD